MAQLSCDSRSRVLSFNFSVWPHCSETDKCRLLAAEASWLVCISPAVLNSCKSLFLLTPALFSPPPARYNPFVKAHRFISSVPPPPTLPFPHFHELQNGLLLSAMASHWASQDSYSFVRQLPFWEALEKQPTLFVYKKPPNSP